MSLSWMLLVTLLFSWASATTRSSRELHVAEDFSNGENLSREVNYLSKNDDAASIWNNDIDAVRKSSIKVPISEPTDDNPVIEYQNLVDDQIGVADSAPNVPFDGDNHSIEPNRLRNKPCPPGCTSFRIGSDDQPRCRCIRELTNATKVPGRVRNLTVKSVFAHNFTLTYEPPLATQTGSVNFTVVLQRIKFFGCEKLHRESPTSYELFSHDWVGWRFSNLSAYVQHKFTVLANTASGQGPPVSIIVKTLPLDIPISKVSNLRLDNESTLAWDPPEDCTTITGPEKVTRLNFSCLSDWGKNWNASHETMGYKFDLKKLNLSPTTRYKVCAYVIMDFGKPANESNCQELQWITESVEPRGIKFLDVYDANAANHTISVRWKAPTSMYGEIESYHVALIIGDSVIQNRTIKISELEKCTENYVCLRNWTLPSNVSTSDVIKLKISAKNTHSDKKGVEITKWFTLDDLYDKGNQSTASIPKLTSKASHTHSSTVQRYNVMLLLVHVIFTRIKLF